VTFIAETPRLFASFWMGGYEGADHVNGDGLALDMAQATGHVQRLDEDHDGAARLGIRTVRESIGWRLAEPRPGQFDFSRALTIAASARRRGLQVLWTLMHYGTPPEVSLFDDAFIERFAAFAAAAGRALAPLHDDAQPPVYTLINEIGFVSWVVSSSTQFHPYRGDGESSEVSGYLVKRRLVRATLAAMQAVRAVDPRARFMQVEPVIHVVAPTGREDLLPLAQEVASYQWQVWDMLTGRMDPELGGHEAALDLIGVNHYHSSQWEVHTEKRLRWHEGDPRRRPLSELLAQTWRRYRRPLVIAETSHFGAGRAAWLNDIAAEAKRASDGGVPVQGLCIYPLVDRHDWNDPAHWHHSGLWDVMPRAPGLPRRLHTGYAAMLAHWQRRLRATSSGNVTMPHLIVLSHLRWDFVFQRPQQLMSCLARHYPVLFVEEPVRSDGAPRLESKRPAPDIEVLVPHTPVDATGFHDDQLPLLGPLLAEHLRERGITDYIVWFYTPMALPLIAAMQPRLVVYDCMDELSAFKDAPRQLHQRETALLKIASLVFAGGPSLYAAKRTLHPRVHCLPSAVNATHFAPSRLDPASDEAREADLLQARIPRPRLGFFGVIDERLDAGLIDAVAAARPDWQLVMVGPVVKIDPATLPRRPNIHWLGMQPYSRLPYLMAGWDVCLMPFARNQATRFISPTKTLEYMAGEKPIVSTPVQDVVSLYGEVVKVAADAPKFIDACATLLAESGRQRGERQSNMMTTVFRASWESTAQCIHGLIETSLRQLAPPRQASPEAAKLVPAAEAAGDGASQPAATPIPARPLRPSRHVRHLVIGAGPTGLAAALALGETATKEDTLLVEREDRVGGWCRSIRQDGFTFDHAGHIMFSDDPAVLELYGRLLGDNLHWQNREAWIYSHGVYTRYPFQGSLYGLPPKVLKECLVGAIEARFGPLGGKRNGPVHARAVPVAPPAHFEEFIHRVWGDGIARHFALPYNRKLWTVPLDEMETSWLGGRVPVPDLEQMIEGALEPAPAPMGPNARFGYPLRGGFQALMDGFLPLLNCELALKSGVSQVSPNRGTVRLSDGRLIGFDALVSTMPLPALVRACGDEAPPDVREAAAGLRQVAVRCVNLGIELPPGVARLTDKHWIYYPEDTVFHRIFVQGNASPHCNAPGGFALTCEISHSADKPLPCDGTALIEQVIADCHRVGIFTPAHRVMSAGQVDMPGAYVVYDHGRAARVQCIRDWFAGFGIVLAGRYAEWAYYNSDHAFIAGRKAAGQVRERLAAMPALALAVAS
jgi:UDP-galactopyranose mutase